MLGLGIDASRPDLDFLILLDEGTACAATRGAEVTAAATVYTVLLTK